ncbi:MAG: membrane dipeptidase [Oscillospiraceae bacterium]|nr:membrane dipeptidase [Oscillospiraceae bacterium]
MKRFICILLMLAMSAGAAGCDAGSRSPLEHGPDEQASSSAEAGSAKPPVTITWDREVNDMSPSMEEPGTAVAESARPDTEQGAAPGFDEQATDAEPGEAADTETPSIDGAQSGDGISGETPDDAGQTGASDPGASTDSGAPPVGQAPAFGLIDAHADTITRALLHNQGMYSNDLHIDFKRLLEYGTPVQVFALWCADKYVPNAFDYTNSLIDFFESEVAKYSDIIEIALSPEDMARNARNGKISAVLAIEGGEALMGCLENLDHFYGRGVRIMTLTWNRENELGYGQATGSNNGLKPFGAQCVQRMEELGMIMDLSHINEAGFWDAHNLSTRPYMASHSNSYALTPHKRNLTDAQIKAVVDTGGIVGLALYPQFLSPSGSASISDILANISHFISLGAGANIGFGSDFDGFDTMPKGVTDVSSFKYLEEKITEAFGDTVARSIMSWNFYEFFVRYFLH